MKLYRLCCEKCGRQIGTYALKSETNIAENLILPCFLIGKQSYEKNMVTQLVQDGIYYDLICFKCGEK